ncbi:hypothetical protein NQD34_001069 [Periophthalmus magnuspinnatus]|nr:hypothetical protein NQD34_001069 [Periophthalmus magnuspinnatus]
MWQMIRSVPTQDKMMFSHRWTFKLFVTAVLCLALNADSQTCDNEIKIRLNTVYETTLGERLRIVCPVQFCDGSIPTIKWFKLEDDSVEVNLRDDIETEWTENNNEGKSFLIFKSVQNSDVGLYQCRSGNVVSHTVNVTLKGDSVNATFQNQNSTSTDDDDDDRGHLWLYLYTAAGIGGIVVIVTVISILLIQCNGKTKNKTQSENQYMDIPMLEQPTHHSSHHTLPRSSPREPPPHRTSRKTQPPSAPPQMVNVYGQMEGHTPGEEGRSVVYAALNHQHLATATSRPRMVVEERSEYAAIRVS